MIAIIKDLDEYYRKVGEYLGYPKCCIEAFIEKSGIHPEFEKIRADVSKGSGFLPCLKHAKMINSGKITLEALIHNRKAKEPFPFLPVEELGRYFVLHPSAVEESSKGYLVINGKLVKSI